MVWTRKNIFRALAWYMWTFLPAQATAIFQAELPSFIIFTIDFSVGYKSPGALKNSLWPKAHICLRLSKIKRNLKTGVCTSLMISLFLSLFLLKKKKGFLRKSFLVCFLHLNLSPYSKFSNSKTGEGKKLIEQKGTCRTCFPFYLKWKLCLFLSIMFYSEMLFHHHNNNWHFWAVIC